MKQITLNIDDSKLQFFKELIKNFDFVIVTEEKDVELTQEQAEYVQGIKSSLQQVDDHLQGKIKLQSAKEFLNGL